MTMQAKPKTILLAKVKLLLKIIITVVFLYWLIKHEKLSLETVHIALSNYKLGLIFFLMTFSQLILGSLRMKVLINSCGSQKFNLKKLIIISWAVSFITSIAPTSLFGDFFRVRSLTKSDSDLTIDDSIYVSFLPKILSLFGLACISAAAGLLVYNQAANLKFFLNSLFVFIFLSVIAFIMREKFIGLISWLGIKLKNALKSEFLKTRIERFIKFTEVLSREPSSFLKSLALSLLIQIFNTLSFVAIIMFVYPDMDINYFYLACLIPIGILIMTLPISFFGLGVGHLAFAKILSMVSINNGADIFTIFFALSFIFNLLGVVPFLILQRIKSTDFEQEYMENLKAKVSQP